MKKKKKNTKNSHDRRACTKFRKFLCIREFPRQVTCKIGLSASVPHRISPLRKITLADLHAVDPHGVLFSLFLSPVSQTPLSFEESSRSYLNSRSTLSRPRSALFQFLPRSRRRILSPPIATGKFIADLNRVPSLSTAGNCKSSGRRRGKGRGGCYFHFVDDKRTSPRCLSRYFLYVYRCH